MNDNHEFPKIIRGCWQLARGHSQQEMQVAPVENAMKYGFKTFDCADIYLGVEELLGEVQKKLRTEHLRIHTKFVPDLDRLADIDNTYIKKIIDRSLKRLNTEYIDLVQFHWWDWKIKNYLKCMEVLDKLKSQGKIKAIGLTNVNSNYLKEFSDNFEIASVQSQVSLFDKRIDKGISDIAKCQNIKILAYGTLLGGFLNEKWLGKAEPQINTLVNRSLVKYKLLIDDACGWTEFQRRLKVLNNIAKQYESKIANIAIASLLQNQQADSVIVGLSPQNYAIQNSNLQKLPILKKKHLAELKSWKCNLYGDAYDAERDKSSQHAKIMKYNLNAQ